MTADTPTTTPPSIATVATAEAATMSFTDEHLSAAFFAAALRNGLPSADEVTVTALHITAGCNTGDNYCSSIYRARVSYALRDGAQIETRSLIIKAMPYAEQRTALLDDLEVYTKEVEMYTQTLPRLSAVLGGERLAAKCFYAVREPVPLIVFEDLKEAGFQMADRLAGLDGAHCELVLRKLGRFHAASMVLVAQDARAFDRFSFGIVKPNAQPNAILDAMFVDGYRTVTELVASWPDYAAEAQKMERIGEDFMAKLDKVCNRTRPAFRVLNHGDMWVNNMLFRYDEAGRPVDVCFVDYQMSVYDSPGHDLNYFWNTSPRKEVREQRSEEIMQLYYEVFARTLVELKAAEAGRITRQMLDEEFEARELYGLMAATGILPFVLMTQVEEGAGSSLDDLAGGDGGGAEQMKKAMYYNEYYVAAMRSIVRRHEEVGLLDRAALIEP